MDEQISTFFVSCFFGGEKGDGKKPGEGAMGFFFPIGTAVDI